ncbi:tetratricopeptide repeat protein [Actinoplanes sp. NBRC 101535]|uniref:tetratricopeptide repeat protein n=1 Tax=Actinoplanes sp. NBRC 101535 TaxID=3032196 RepID=UPI002555CBDC|nr:tetratricopeptide repeat protein [Actinoplanes sp. NBRC 101535]
MTGVPDRGGRAHAERARLLADVGRFAEAAEVTRAGLAEAPTDPVLLVLLAGLFRLQGMVEPALAAAERAIAVAPHLAGTHIERAECLLLSERLDEAVSEAREAVRLEPSLPDAHRALARALALRRDFDEARTAAARALSLDPHSVPDLLTLAEVERAAGRRDAAGAAARALLAEDPDNPGGRWLVALLDAERLHVGAAMRGLRHLAADHPARLDAAALTFPIRGLLAGLRRGLLVGIPLTTLLALAGFWWSPSTLLSRATAVVVAAVMLGFSARVLIPARTTPWRCLPLLPPSQRRAVLTAVATAPIAVTFLLAYALTPHPSSLAAAAVALALLLATARADRQ